MAATPEAGLSDLKGLQRFVCYNLNLQYFLVSLVIFQHISATFMYKALLMYILTAYKFIITIYVIICKYIRLILCTHLKRGGIINFQIRQLGSAQDRRIWISNKDGYYFIIYFYEAQQSYWFEVFKDNKRVYDSFSDYTSFSSIDSASEAAEAWFDENVRQNHQEKGCIIYLNRYKANSL